MPRRKCDSALFVKFSLRAIVNEHKSWGHVWLDNENKPHEVIEAAGRVISDDVDYIHIEIPGDRENIVDREVMCCDKRLLAAPKPGQPLNISPHCRARKDVFDQPMLEECDVHRFFDEFVAYKSGQAEQTQGTDLKLWAGINPSAVEELAFYKVYTVEQLAEMADSLVGNYLPLRQRARDYLAKTKDEAASLNAIAQKNALEKGLAAEREERQKLEQQIKEQQEQIAELIAAGKGGKKNAQREQTT
jgi:hypothetical protein